MEQKITKSYGYFIEFDSGSCEFEQEERELEPPRMVEESEKRGTGRNRFVSTQKNNIPTALMFLRRAKAPAFAEHLISIESNEDASDINELGFAQKRSEAIHEFFVQNSVDPARITQKCSIIDCAPGSKSARHSYINLYHPLYK